MENYGNLTVKVLGMFHAFLRWKEKGIQAIILRNRLWQIPELVVKGCLLHSWVFSNHATQVERAPGARPDCRTTKTTNGAKTDMRVRCTKTVASASNNKWQETVWQLPGNSQFHRISWKIAHWQSRTFFMCILMFSLELGSSQGRTYKFQLKDNAKPARHAPRKVPIHLQDAFSSWNT